MIINYFEKNEENLSHSQVADPAELPAMTQWIRCEYNKVSSMFTDSRKLFLNRCSTFEVLLSKIPKLLKREKWGEETRRDSQAEQSRINGEQFQYHRSVFSMLSHRHFRRLAIIASSLTLSLHVQHKLRWKWCESISCTHVSFTRWMFPN